MTTARAISLFLIDGVPDGRIAGEIFNWTGKAYKLPRRLVSESGSRPDLSRAGIYLLVGRPDDSASQPHVYVGEAEAVFPRLKQHLSEKDFWTDAMAFVSKDENLNKAHVKYLENQVYVELRNAQRVELENSNVPSSPAMSELEQAVMDEFLANVKVLAGVLGYRFFDPLVSARNRTGTDSAKEEPTEFYIRAARGANAQAISTNEGIVVLQGSRASLDVVQSTQETFIRAKQELIDSGVLALDEDTYLFTKDHLFSSPSRAAAVVMGRNANGRTEWKTAAGKTFAEIETSS